VLAFGRRSVFTDWWGNLTTGSSLITCKLRLRRDLPGLLAPTRKNKDDVSRFLLVGHWDVSASVRPACVPWTAACHPGIMFKSRNADWGLGTIRVGSQTRGIGEPLSVWLPYPPERVPTATRLFSNSFSVPIPRLSNFFFCVNPLLVKLILTSLERPRGLCIWLVLFQCAKYIIHKTGWYMWGCVRATRSLHDEVPGIWFTSCFYSSKSSYNFCLLYFSLLFLLSSLLTSTSSSIVAVLIAKAGHVWVSWPEEFLLYFLLLTLHATGLLLSRKRLAYAQLQLTSTIKNQGQL